jgi:hypothetical protein
MPGAGIMIERKEYENMSNILEDVQTAEQLFAFAEQVAKDPSIKADVGLLIGHVGAMKSQLSQLAIEIETLFEKASPQLISAFEAFKNAPTTPPTTAPKA